MNENTREIKTVALYFWGIPNDGNGTVYVIKWLADCLREMGLRVCIITEDAPSENDIAIEAERFVLPKIADEYSAEGREKRVRDLSKLLAEQKIDLLIDNKFYSPLVQQNGLAAKSCGCRYVVYDHGYFPSWMCKPEADFAERVYGLRVCDAVVSLTEEGKRFYDYLGVPSAVLPNPPMAKSADAPRTQQKKRVLWLGRLASEKKPLEAIRAFALLKERMPEATLTVAGIGYLEQETKRLAAELGVEDVLFVGFQSDKEALYRSADVLLMTSESESWSLSLREAQACAMPAVCYDIPNLEILHEDCGVLAVPQDDATALADVLYSVLAEEAYYRKLSENALNVYKAQEAFDLVGAWKAFLAQLADGKTAELLSPVSDADKAVVQSMIRYHSVGMRAVCAENDRLKPLAAKGSSRAYRLGNALLRLPKKLLGRG